MKWVKPLDQFGGWLTFFWVSCFFSILRLTFSSVKSVLHVFSIGASLNVWIMVLPHIIIPLIFAGLSYYISKVVRIQATSTPSRIVRLLILLAVAGVLYEVFTVVNTYYINHVWSARLTELVLISVKDLVLELVWVVYFIRSKRVKQFYSHKNIP